MILKSIGRYYRNKLINKGVKGLLKGGVSTAAVIAVLSFVLPYAMKAANIDPTAVALEFKSNVTTTFEEIKEDACNLFVGDVANVVANTDYSSEESVQNMSGEVAQMAETFANENGVEFHRASVIRVVDGDTIVVDICGENCGNKDHESTIRLGSINTPESVASEEYLQSTGKENTIEGQEASAYLKEILEDTSYIYLEYSINGTDKYNREICYGWFEVPDDEMDIKEISTNMINAILVKEGYADVEIYYPDVKYADYLYEIEENAIER